MDKELETVSGKVVLLERTSLESLKNENAVSGTMSLHPLIELNGLEFNFIQNQISVKISDRSFISLISLKDHLIPCCAWVGIMITYHMTRH